VEAAICLPIFVFLALAVFSFGWLYHHQLILNHAAREAARRGAVGATDAEIGAALRAQCVGLDKTRLHWTITPPDTSPDRAADNTLTIKLQYDDQLPIAIIAAFTGPRTLSARADIQIEVYPRML
jgi:Flp pilus assembly protein TadG